jgi:ferrous iron transport protein A
MAALHELIPGQSGEIVTVTGEPAVVQRLYELGLIEGETVEFLAAAPLGDPIEIRVGNTRLSLRNHDAAGVSVNITTTPAAAS